eukprot:3927439-Amphidinium_carterae.1
MTAAELEHMMNVSTLVRLGSGLVAGAAAVPIASMCTTTVTVAQAGLWGYLGYTTTYTVAAYTATQTMAIGAAVAFPVAAVAAGGSMIVYGVYKAFS